MEAGDELPNYLTPLYSAVMDGDAQRVGALLAAGINIDAEPVDEGYTALHCAVQSGRIDVVRLLLSAGCPKSLNMFDYVAHTPLMWAAQNGHHEIAKALIVAGADLNANDEERIGDTAIKYAVESIDLKMVTLLFEAGANPKIPGWMQVSALLKAEIMAQNSREESHAKRIYALLKPPA